MYCLIFILVSGPVRNEAISAGIGRSHRATQREPLLAGTR